MGFRWWLFKQISWIGWAICPEPHRSLLIRFRPGWEDVEAFLAEPERPS